MVAKEDNTQSVDAKNLARHTYATSTAKNQVAAKNQGAAKNQIATKIEAIAKNGDTAESLTIQTLIATIGTTIG